MDREESNWTLLTNHGMTLVYVALNPHATVREAAEAVGITERATARILAELRTEGYLVARRVGRRNTYEVVLDAPMRRLVERHFSVAQLITGLLDGAAVPLSPGGRALRVRR